MNKMIGKLLAWGAGGFLALGLSITSYGAETRTPINSVSVSLGYTMSVGDESDGTDIAITPGSPNYQVGDYAWVGAPSTWRAGDIPKLKITFYAKSGYYFNTTSSSSRFDISGGEYFTSRRADSNETLELTVKLDRVTGSLGDTDNAQWSDWQTGYGEWSEVPNAGYYELKLYRNGSLVQSLDQISPDATSYDFFPYMTRKGTYSFKVRAVARNATERRYLSSGNWVESDDLDISESQVSNGQPGAPANPSNPGPGGNQGVNGTPGSNGTYGPNGTYGSNGRPNQNAAQPGWQQDSKGWWYRNPDGTYQKGDWFLAKGKWYLFDSNGYMLTGWQTRNGKRYYMNPSGDMQVGWLRFNNHWYYMGPSGDMQTGWVVLNNVYYHLDGNGVMQTGWVPINGYYYYFNTDGSMARNTYIGQYYVNQDGVWVQ